MSRAIRAIYGTALIPGKSRASFYRLLVAFAPQYRECAGRRRLWRGARPNVLHRVAILPRGQHLQTRLLGAQLASCALGLRPQRRQESDAEHSRHGLPLDPAHGVPPLPRRQCAFGRQTRTLGGSRPLRNRSQTGSRMRPSRPPNDSVLYRSGQHLFYDYWHCREKDDGG